MFYLFHCVIIDWKNKLIWPQLLLFEGEFHVSCVYLLFCEFFALKNNNNFVNSVYEEIQECWNFDRSNVSKNPISPNVINFLHPLRLKHCLMCFSDIPSTTFHPGVKVFWVFWVIFKGVYEVKDQCSNHTKFIFQITWAKSINISIPSWGNPRIYISVAWTSCCSAAWWEREKSGR